MILKINEYDPIENAYKIDISVDAREDVIDCLIYKLNETIDTLTSFKEGMVRSKQK